MNNNIYQAIWKLNNILKFSFKSDTCTRQYTFSDSNNSSHFQKEC